MSLKNGSLRFDKYRWFRCIWCPNELYIRGAKEFVKHKHISGHGNSIETNSILGSKVSKKSNVRCKRNGEKIPTRSTSPTIPSCRPGPKSWKLAVAARNRKQQPLLSHIQKRRHIQKLDPNWVHIRRSSVQRRSTVYECKYCSKKFRYSGHLQEHEKRHDGLDPFKCQLCGERFSRKHLLNAHRSSHFEQIIKQEVEDAEDNKDHQEPEAGTPKKGKIPCGKPICDIYTLRVHKALVHDIEEPQDGKNKAKTPGTRFIVCPFCPKKCTKSNLKQHLRVHNGEKPYECDVCHQRFTLPGDITVHKRTVHEGLKAFDCSVCGYKFSRRGSLNVHMRNHTGEKNYACNFCDKKFTRNTARNQHEATHLKKIANN